MTPLPARAEPSAAPRLQLHPLRIRRGGDPMSEPYDPLAVKHASQANRSRRLAERRDGAAPGRVRKFAHTGQGGGMTGEGLQAAPRARA